MPPAGTFGFSALTLDSEGTLVEEQPASVIDTKIKMAVSTNAA
jgi:hypothetical protein